MPKTLFFACLILVASYSPCYAQYSEPDYLQRQDQANMQYQMEQQREQQAQMEQRMEEQQRQQQEMQNQIDYQDRSMGGNPNFSRNPNLP